MGFERAIAAPQCVALALFSNNNISGKMCIITDDGELCEICIIEIGNGVIEVQYTTWGQSGMDNISAICSRVQPNVKIEQLGQIIYVADNIYLPNLYDFERCFGRPVLRLSNIADICNLGISIHKKIMQGPLKDVLLLDVITQTIYFQNPTGDIIRMIEANTTIPTIISDTIEVSGADTEYNIGRLYTILHSTGIHLIQPCVLYRKPLPEGGVWGGVSICNRGHGPRAYGLPKQSGRRETGKV